MWWGVTLQVIEMVWDREKWQGHGYWLVGMWNILDWYGIALCVGKFDHVPRLVGIGFVVEGWVELIGD